MVQAKVNCQKTVHQFLMKIMIDTYLQFLDQTIKSNPDLQTYADS